MNVYFHTVQVEQNRIGMAHNLAQSAQSLKFVQYQLGLIDKAAVMAIN